MEKRSTCSPRKSPCTEHWCTWRKLQPAERSPACTGAVSLAEAHGGPTLEQSTWEELHPREGTHDGTLLKELQSIWSTSAEETHEGLYPKELTQCCSRGRFWRGMGSSSEALGTGHNPIFHPPCYSEKRRWKNCKWSKVEAWEKGRVRRRCS